MWEYITENERMMDTISELKDIEVLALDIETRGLDVFTDEILLVQIGTERKTYIYDARLLDLKRFFDQFNFNNLFLLHNSNFDLKFLLHNYGWQPVNIFDTMIAEHLISCGIGKVMSSLNDLCFKYLGVTLVKEIRDTFQDQIAYFSDQQLNYAADDVEVLLKLYPILCKEIRVRDLNYIFYEIESKLILPTLKMELTGVKLDRKIWTDCYEDAKRRKELTEVDLREFLKQIGYINVWRKTKGVAYQEKIEYLNINLNSPAQVKECLKRMKVNAKDTSAEELSQFLDVPFVITLLKYRGYQKACTTYGLNFFENIHPYDDRIHSHFNQIGTVTGRYSSSNPNAQNIKNPKKLKPWEKKEDVVNYRSAFVPTDGYIMLTSDYSQIELRLLAELSQEPAFLDAFRSGIDLHKNTAMIAYELISIDDVEDEQRTIAKNINFGVAYGSGAWNLVKKFNLTLESAENVLKRFHEGYPLLTKFLSSSGQETLEQGYASTILGRRRNFLMPSFDDNKFYQKVARIKREGTNSKVQGSSADMIKIAIINIDQELRKIGGRILMTVHDEIVSEVPLEYESEGLEIIKSAMIKAGELLIKTIPVDVHIEASMEWSK